MDYLSKSDLSTLVLRSVKYLFRARPQIRIVREPPREDPVITVIIPTYNRSNVLRLAIQGVMWQTEQHFELLVMGDGCTDDSESVVKSFGDARIRWHNLPFNTGHQSAPVNAALALARGRYIAFLGHDDLWHPDHLRTQLAAIRRAKAGASLAVLLMRGPKGSNYRVVSNVFPGGVHDPVKCSPPSGLMISREVYERIGGWADYRSIWRNPECEFQHQAHLAGFQFVSTGELTVYKFPSLLWKKAYVDKPCGEQSAYVERIQEQRWFLLQETLDLARVHFLRLPMLAPTLPVPPSPHTPGWAVSHYRKFRGLE